MKILTNNKSCGKIEVCIVVTTYNCPKHIDGLFKSIQLQKYKNYAVVVADDGSTDNTLDVINGFKEVIKDLYVLPLEHGERGLARYVAINHGIKLDPTYLLIIDADMMMKANLLQDATEYMENNATLDALIIKEIPYTSFDNYYSKVKVFERHIINNDGKVDLKHSIEAARFWRLSSYLETGGINRYQIAFEEIQPTIRCLEEGGEIERLHLSGLYHDEKKVTLANILEKKKYYFSKMSTTIETESNGFLKALQRWYLFRPVYYQKKNLLLYLRYPHYFIGMLQMYFLLTMVGGYELIVALIKNRFFNHKEVTR